MLIAEIKIIDMKITEIQVAKYLSVIFISSLLFGELFSVVRIFECMPCSEYNYSSMMCT